jgi:hypothetical protein
MTYRTIYTEVEVEVDLSEFTTAELIAELDSRSESVQEKTHIGIALEQIYYLKSRGADYTDQLDKLIYQVTGRF